MQNIENTAEIYELVSRSRILGRDPDRKLSLDKRLFAFLAITIFQILLERISNIQVRRSFSSL